MDAAPDSTVRAVGGADGEGTSNARCRTYSKEIDVDDVVAEDAKVSRSSDVTRPRSVSAMPAKKTKKSADTSSLRNSSVAPPQTKASRRSRRLSAAAHDEELEAEKKEVKDDVEQEKSDEEEDAPKSQKRVSKRVEQQLAADLPRKPNKITSSVKIEENLETDGPLEPTPSTASKSPKLINPNSALAIRQKLMESEDITKKRRKSLVVAKKATIVEHEAAKGKKILKEELADDSSESAPGPSSSTSITKPEPMEVDETTVPSSSAEPAATVLESPTNVTTPKVLFKTPAMNVRAIRSSGRVSKPNRLYVDQDYNTEVLGRDTVTQQNIVIEVIPLLHLI